MTLPATGPLSASQVNTEIGRSATSVMTLNESAVRSIAGAGFATPGTTISYNDLRGKSASGSEENESPAVVFEINQGIGNPNSNWQSPANVLTQNTAYSSYTINNVNSGTDHPGTDWIVVRNFGFAVPTGKVLTNLSVQVNCGFFPHGDNNGTRGDVYFRGLRLNNNPGFFGNDKSAFPSASHLLVPRASYATYTFQGNPTYWGNALNYTTINSSNFGVGAFFYNTDGNNDADGAIRIRWIRVSVFW